MRIEYLREFLAVSKSLNLTITANELYITQPVLSKHLKAIEAELGQEFFYHEKRRVQLTQAGEMFAESVEAILAEYDLAIVRLNMLRAGYSGKVTVGYLYGAVGFYLPHIRKKFHERFPDVMLEFISMEYDNMLDALDAGRVDVCLGLDLSTQLHERFDVQCVYQDCICAVMSHDHPQASKRQLRLSDLGDEIFILPHPTYMRGFFDYCGRMFAAAKIIPKTGGYYQEIAMRSLAFTGEDFVSLMCAHTRRVVESEDADIQLVYVPLSDDMATVSVSAIWNKADSRNVVTGFVDVAREVVHREVDGGSFPTARAEVG